MACAIRASGSAANGLQAVSPGHGHSIEDPQLPISGQCHRRREYRGGHFPNVAGIYQPSHVALCFALTDAALPGQDPVQLRQYLHGRYRGRAKCHRRKPAHWCQGRCAKGSFAIVQFIACPGPGNDRGGLRPVSFKIRETVPRTPSLVLVRRRTPHLRYRLSMRGIVTRVPSRTARGSRENCRLASAAGTLIVVFNILTTVVRIVSGSMTPLGSRHLSTSRMPTVLRALVLLRPPSLIGEPQLEQQFAQIR